MSTPVLDIKGHGSIHYGTIPRTMLEAKFEITDIDEDIDGNMDKYYREILKDRFPDNIATNAEEPRRSGLSESGALNLRFGGTRGSRNPEHPEMFQGFSDKDPRGTATGPDFKKFTDDSWRRKERTEMNVYPDKAEPIMTGGSINPVHAVKRNVDMFKEVKDRTRIFTTARDNQMAGQNYLSSNDNLKGLRYQVDDRPDAKTHYDMMMYADNWGGIDMTTKLSNVYTGQDQRRSVGDQRVKVAVYGDPRKGPRLTDMRDGRAKNAAHCIMDEKQLKNQLGHMRRSLYTDIDIASAIHSTERDSKQQVPIKDSFNRKIKLSDSAQTKIDLMTQDSDFAVASEGAKNTGKVAVTHDPEIIRALTAMQADMVGTDKEKFSVIIRNVHSQGDIEPTRRLNTRENPILKGLSGKMAARYKSSGHLDARTSTSGQQGKQKTELFGKAKNTQVRATSVLGVSDQGSLPAVKHEHATGRSVGSTKSSGKKVARSFVVGMEGDQLYSGVNDELNSLIG